MKTFEVTWSMFGEAQVEAETEEEAHKLASEELIEWSGFGTELDDVMVSGAQVEVQP